MMHKILIAIFLLNSLVANAALNVGNALSIQSIFVNPTAPTNGQCLVYDATSQTYIPSSCGSGGGGVTTMGAFGSSPNANAGTISGSTLTLQPASATAPGGIALAAQTMGTGAKTFSSNILCATNGGCALGAAATKMSNGFFGTAVQIGGTTTLDGTVDGTGTLDIRNATTGTTTAGMGHIGLIKSSGADNTMPSLKLFSHSGYATNLIFPGGPDSSGNVGEFGFDNTYIANSAPRYIAVSHDFIYDTDGSGNIGQSADHRPATIYALTNINLASLTASKVLFSDASKNITSTGTVSASQGGTGQSTLTANNVILGNGTSAVQFVAPGTSGNALVSNGTTWTSAAVSTPSPSFAAFGSTPNANGASITSGVITLQPADASNPGGVSSTTQSFAGIKTFVSGAFVNGFVTQQTTSGTQVDKKQIPNLVTTTDATVTSLFTETLSDNTVYKYVADCVARQTNSANRAGYKREVTVYREAAGAATIQGSILAGYTEESNSVWDLTWDVSSNDVRLRATGASSATIDWACHVEQQKVN